MSTYHDGDELPAHPDLYALPVLLTAAELDRMVLAATPAILAACLAANLATVRGSK